MRPGRKQCLPAHNRVSARFQGVELRHLRYFLAVAEHRHFGRAADQLHIAQPPLSQQIKQLESELGVRLLERTTRRVELTIAGARFAARASDILAAVDQAPREARRIAGGLQGALVVGFTGSASYRLMPQVARAVRAALPDVELELRGEMLTPAQVTALQDGRIDLAVLRPPVAGDGIVIEALSSEPLVAALPDVHRLAARDRVAIEDLAGEPFVAYPGSGQSVVHEAVAAACREAGFTPTASIEVTETATLVSFVAAGVGVALVPESVMDLAVTGVVYRPLTATPPRVELAAAWRADDDSPLPRNVRDVLQSLFSVPDGDV